MAVGHRRSVYEDAAEAVRHARVDYGRFLPIAIVGAGMGGLAAAATLRAIGAEVQVYEQAPRFARIGAGIQMMPNSMKVLRGIGVEERLRRTRLPAVLAPEPGVGHRRSDRASCRCRRAFTARRTCACIAATCTMRSPRVVPTDIVHLGKKLVGLDQNAATKSTLTFADGTQVRAPTR